MSDTTMREAVLWEFTYDAGVHRLCRVADMADEIRRLRDENTAFRAAVERVRAACENDLRWVDAQPILRALEGTP